MFRVEFWVKSSFFTFQVQQDNLVVGDAVPQEVGAQESGEAADNQQIPEVDSSAAEVSWNDGTMYV